jgi:hypothetical protein
LRKVQNDDTKEFRQRDAIEHRGAHLKR